MVVPFRWLTGPEEPTMGLVGAEPDVKHILGTAGAMGRNSRVSAERASICPAGDEQRIVVTIERANPSSPTSIEAQLLDISSGGIKLQTSSCLRIEESIVVGLDVQSLGLSLALPATVSWARPVDGEAWHLGCVFSSSLAEETLDKLAAAGHLQRRGDPRIEISIDGYVRWEACEERVPARITDVSVDGFCICIPQTDSMGKRLLMEVENGQDAAIRIPARVRWSKELDRGFATGTRYLSLGCTFMDKKSFGLLRKRFLQTAST